MRTNYDALVTKLLPLARKIETPDIINQRQAVRTAVSLDGFINPGSLLYIDDDIVEGYRDPDTHSTSSTSLWENAARHHFYFLGKKLRLRIQAEARGGNTDGANIDVRLVFDGKVLDSDSLSGPSVSASPFFLLGMLTIETDGDHTAEVLFQFKSATSGTSTVRSARILIDGQVLQ